MPRYTNGDEWIEVVGTRKMPMSAFHDLYGGIVRCAPIMRRVLKDHNLIDWDGIPVDFARMRQEVETKEDKEGNKIEVTISVPDANVSADQLQFIRESILDAIKTEALDPEV